MIVFETPKVEIGLRENPEGTYMKFKQQLSNEEFRQAHEKLLEFFRTRSLYRHSVDARHMGIVSTENQNFVANEIIPKMAEAAQGGFLYIAMILGEDAFAKFAHQNIRKKATHYMENVAFPGETEAMDYLRNCQPAQNVRAS